MSNSKFFLYTAATHCNNTVYFLPTDDAWTLAVLNAPVSWWYAWRTAQHGKDEALRFFTDYLNAFPIPQPQAGQRETVGAAIAELRGIVHRQQEGRVAFLDWLRVEFDVAKPSQKLQALTALEPDTLAAEVKKASGRAKPLSVADVKRLRAEHAASVEPLHALPREAGRLERRVSDAVNAAYDLTPADVALLWQTAPPRMPLSPG